MVKTLLNKNTDGKDKNEDSFYHMSIVGSLPCLARRKRTDASMAVHQAVKFSNEPKASHDTAVKLVGKCLLCSLEEGLTCRLEIRTLSEDLINKMLKTLFLYAQGLDVLLNLLDAQSSGFLNFKQK